MFEPVPPERIDAWLVEPAPVDGEAPDTIIDEVAASVQRRPFGLDGRVASALSRSRRRVTRAGAGGRQLPREVRMTPPPSVPWLARSVRGA